MRFIMKTFYRWWKQILALILIVIVINVPDRFIIYNLDVAYKLIMGIGGLILARMGKSAYDSWQSHCDTEKSVSVSKYMNETGSELGKGIVHASQIIAIAIIVAVAIK